MKGQGKHCVRSWLLLVCLVKHSVDSAIDSYGEDFNLDSGEEKEEFSKWTKWSSCSVSCGGGIVKRYRICQYQDWRCKRSVQTKKCFPQFCPSYLTWPRIHFSGQMVAEVNTVNNIRCAYENDKFSPAELSKQFIHLQKYNITHTYYKHMTGNWNPDGTNQVYFQDTFVTSFCRSPGECSTADPIVGLKVTETSRGVMAVLDVDWQLATEIWGLRVKIPGILEGSMVPSSHQVEKWRLNTYKDKSMGYSIPNMSRYKSKLRNITWYDHHYQKLFHHAEELSFSFLYDLFNQESLEGRITGTIGLTSLDDPLETFATRAMHASYDDMTGMAPFFYHVAKRFVTLDMSFSIDGQEDGGFLPNNYGKLDLALELPKKIFCRYFDKLLCLNEENENSLVWKGITHGGEISRLIGQNSDWYLKYGGVLDIDLSKVSDKILFLMKYNRLALMTQDKLSYIAELPRGMSYGMFQEPIVRLNPNQSHRYEVFVSSFGKPVESAYVSMLKISNRLGNTDCGRPSCNQSMGTPESTLEITPGNSMSLTNSTGMISFIAKAAKDPGNPRGCGLDGQVYPIQIFIRYTIPRTGKHITYSDSDSLLLNPVVASFRTSTLSVAVRIYSDVIQKECPTWKDVKDIFIQYYNLYPAMWKYGVIDLHSYEQVKKKAKILKASMFDTPFTSPRYMPISRDLSRSKKQLIWNWMKCGMKRTTETKQAMESCKLTNVETKLDEIKRLLQSAVMLELSTIPPYVTAWLSLKTSFGRNKEIALILKSIFNEEMLHLTLAGNILNAIGGTVNFTDASQLPSYPTVLALGNSYQLFPSTEVSIFPFSIGLVEDVFSEIEKPTNKKHREVLYHIAQLWQMLRTDSSNEEDKAEDRDTEMPPAMKQLLKEIPATSKRNDLDSSVDSDSITNPKTTAKLNFSESVVLNNSSANSSADLSRKKWHSTWMFAEKGLQKLQVVEAKTVASFYAIIALKLTSLESCVYLLSSNDENKSNILPGTLFTGDRTRQLNSSHWYGEDEESAARMMEQMRNFVSTENSYEEMVIRRKKRNAVKSPLAEVVDLKTALEAIVEIVYQGEGGSDCTPFVTPEIYSSQSSNKMENELSHYYRFQEIIHGRKLVKVPTPIGSDWNCLNASQRNDCPALVTSGMSYCYVGDKITFHADGVWPILPNPADEYYRKGTMVYKLNHQFNLLYTRLLFCLQDVFLGKPFMMKQCMTLMYDMTIAGKRLVSTPLGAERKTFHLELGTTEMNGSPTWRFVRELPFRAGLPIR